MRGVGITAYACGSVTTGGLYLCQYEGWTWGLPMVLLGLLSTLQLIRNSR